MRLWLCRSRVCDTITIKEPNMDAKMQAVLMEMMQKMGGIENFQANPMAFIGEVFKHPELLSQIDQLVKTPEMQREIAQSMNNPMFQQIMANNPILSGLSNRYGAAAQAQPQDDEEQGDIEVTNSETDDPKEICLDGWRRIDWLNPPSNRPFYIDQDATKRTHFDDILEELPEECRDRVTEIANARLELHLDEAHRERLAQIAKSNDLTPLDLMATQGFMGEVCYCASLLMPEDDLCDLAKFALTALHLRSGYPVASYLLQVLLYIDSFDDITEDDWNNFIWSLTSNPATGRDGNFCATLDDAATIASIAAEQLIDKPDMIVAIVMALIHWCELADEIDDCDSPVFELLEDIEEDKELQNALAPSLKEFLDGKKFCGIGLAHLRENVRQCVVDDIHRICDLS